jgi:hypothetical protein
MPYAPTKMEATGIQYNTIRVTLKMIWALKPCCNLREREREREGGEKVMEDVKYYIQGEENNFPALKVSRQCPLVLLVELDMRGRVKR